MLISHFKPFKHLYYTFKAFWQTIIFCLAKLVAVGYGIKKLVITCVVEDDKVGTDDLEEAITAFEDYVRFNGYLTFLLI